MPEVIDLISSSPDMRAAKPKPTTQKNKTTITTTVSKSRIDSPHGKGWYAISSDDFEPQTLPYELSKPPNNGQRNPIGGAFSFDSLPLLSSDDYHFNLSSPKAPSHLKAKNSTNAAQPTKRARDLVYISDDFDSSVNLDKSIDDFHEPAPKKARASSSTMDTAFSKALKSQGTSSRFSTSTRGPGQERSYSNDEPLTRRTISLPKPKKSTMTVSQPLDVDPILFTSSPDPYMEALRRKMDKRKHNLSADRGDILGILPELSSNTELSDINPLPISSKSRLNSSTTAFEKYEAEREKEKKANAKKVEKAKKAANGKDEKIKKAAAKEVEKERKRLEKEAKFIEKEKAAAIAKVNILRTDKKVSAPEMIVDLPTSLESNLSAQTGALLSNFNIEHTEWDSQLPVVKLRRKVTAIYSDEQGQWMPCDRHIKNEKHVIYVMIAQEFVDLVTDRDERKDFDTSILRLKAKFEDCKILILMQGYHTWIRKNQNLKNRQYTQAVRAAGPQQGDITAASQRRKKKEPEYVDEELLENALLRLQMIHGLLIHHTAVMQETAEQLAVFTQHISLIPYKAQKQINGTMFCMESGQVKTGDGPADTYVKMLQEMVRLTAGVAYSITSKYPTVRELVEGLQENGPLDLEECRKSSNKNGAFTDQRVGPAISKRVYKVFMGRDPNSLDI